MAKSPVITTSMALKNLKLVTPKGLNEITEKKLFGIDQEPESIRKSTLQQAEDYARFRSGALGRKKNKLWKENCKKVVAEKISDRFKNPYCLYEMTKTDSSSNSDSSRTTSAVKKQINKLIEENQFQALIKFDATDIARAVNSLSHKINREKLVDAILDQKSCVPNGLAGSLAYKLEEDFPEKNWLDRARALYRKGYECDAGLSKAKAGFRLGLLLIWENQCSEIKNLMTNVEQTPAAAAYHARANYWRYYCALQLNQTQEVENAKASLMKNFAFSFQNLAVNGRERSFHTQTVESPTPSATFRSLIRPDINPFLLAAEGLIRQNKMDLASEILDRNTDSLLAAEPEVMLYTTVLLTETGFALPKFKILSHLFQISPDAVSDSTLRLYFPLRYFELLKSKESKIDPLLLLSLIRQESAFNPVARSMAGARGLMQVMPSTARSIASVRTSKLYDPKTNIHVGTKYLLKRLNQYDGDVELTLAAYNAGFSRVDQWIKRYPTDNKMLFLDLIPYKETRDYVMLILRNYYWYVKLYGDESNTTSTENVKPPANGKDTSADERKMNRRASKMAAILDANAGIAAGVRKQ